MTQQPSRYTVHQDKDATGMPVRSWYVQCDGKPFAFFDKKEEAERCAANYRRMAGDRTP